MSFRFIAGQQNSTPLQIGTNQGALVLQFPAAMTGTSVEVQGSLDGTNYFPIYVDGVQLTVGFVASSLQCIKPGTLFGVRNLRLRSSAVEAAEVTVGCSTSTVVD